jgi:hypothetical protein
MRTDYLMPPLPVTPRAAFCHAGQPAAEPISGDYRGTRLTLDPNVRKTHSLFPCMTSIFNTIRCRLGLSRPPSTLLNQTERANVETYKRFRAFAGDIGKGVVDKYPDYFKDIDLPTTKVASLHRKFHRELDDCIAKSFADVLRDKRAQDPGVDFPDAVCNAYQSIYESVIDKLLANPRIYPKGYADTLKASLNDILDRLKSAISPGMNPPAPTLVSTLAPEALAVDGSALVAETLPVGHLSQSDYQDFGDLQFEIGARNCIERMEEFEAAAGSQGYPKLSIYHFQSEFLDGFKDFLRYLPASGVSIDGLHSAYHRAMKSAVKNAVDEGVKTQEILPSQAGELKKMLITICDDINTEIEKRADPRIAKLFKSKRSQLTLARRHSAPA